MIHKGFLFDFLRKREVSQN